jgi:hypothetical protein
VKILFRDKPGSKWVAIEGGEYSDERHLQEILLKDPGIIPTEEIDLGLTRIELVVGEVGILGGSSDIVGLDHVGNIYIIETKLAKSPEVKKQVVGQILGYAAGLRQKRIEWLEGVVREKTGHGFEIFEKYEGWNREEFEQRLKSALEDGKFGLLIVVDKMNSELDQIIDYLNDTFMVGLYALELRYFKGEGGAEMLVPDIHGHVRKPPEPARTWDESSFFEEAVTQVDHKTLQSMKELYEFSRQNGRVDFGRGRTYGTFRFYVQYRDREIPLYNIASDGKHSWMDFADLAKLGVDNRVEVEYLRKLKSLGLPFNEHKHLEGYPFFDLKVLNQENKLSSFKECTLELVEQLK